MDLNDQDGFVTSFLHFLWHKDPIRLSVPALLIPDTIIYHNSSPTHWYFSHENQVKQRSKSKMTPEYIKQFLLKKRSRSGVVALWVNETQKCVYEYLDDSGLERFFDDKVTIKQGVLQSFIDPKGMYNTTLRCIWGPKLCLFEKCTNRFKIDDEKIDMYQRILTYEVDKMQQITEQLIGKSLSQALECKTFSLVDHIQFLTNNRFQIKRLVLNFRIDQDDKLWLLGCSSIRVYDEKNKVKIFKPVYDVDKLINVPYYVDLKRIALKNQTSLQMDSCCQCCDLEFNRNDVYSIKLKEIVESWNFDHIGQSNSQGITPRSALEKNRSHLFKKDGLKSPLESPRQQTKQVLFFKGIQTTNKPLVGLPLDMDKNYKVPDIIRKLMPRIKEKKYLEYLSSPVFMELEITACQDCYDQINRGVRVKEDLGKMAYIEKLVPKLLLGTGQQKPQYNRKIYEITRRDIINKEKQKMDDLDYRKPLTHRQHTRILSDPEIRNIQLPSMESTKLNSISYYDRDTQLLKPILTYRKQNQYNQYNQ